MEKRRCKRYALDGGALERLIWLRPQHPPAILAAPAALCQASAAPRAQARSCPDARSGSPVWAAATFDTACCARRRSPRLGRKKDTVIRGRCLSDTLSGLDPMRHL